MHTEAHILTDLIDAVVNRLGDIANDLRDDLRSPALAEVRAAARAAERAYVLLSPWTANTGNADLDDILDAVVRHILRIGTIPMPPDEHFDNATIEVTTLDTLFDGCDQYVRVTMPGCVYLVIGEVDADDEGRGTKACWSVVGRYPQ